MCNVLPFGQVIQVAAILGITPPGYHLVPEGVAKEWLSAYDSFDGDMQGYANRRVMADRAMYLSLASALSPKEVEER